MSLPRATIKRHKPLTRSKHVDVDHHGCVTIHGPDRAELLQQVEGCLVGALAA